MILMPAIDFHQNCKFHDPRDMGSCAWPYGSYSENALFLSFKIFFSTPWQRTDNLCDSDDDEEGSTKSVNFITSTSRVGVLD